MELLFAILAIMLSWLNYLLWWDYGRSRFAVAAAVCSVISVTLVARYIFKDE